MSRELVGKTNWVLHRAKHAAYVAFTLCEFLQVSYEYQKKKEERRTS
jgi:hypothetical protein